ncbi:MAG: hypothetical protein ACERKN_17485 [Velocimicrobium sp.]
MNKIEYLKQNIKKLILLSVTLIAIGIGIGTIGFAMMGFQMSNLAKPGENHWYQTIQVDDQGVYSIGVSIGKK